MSDSFDCATFDESVGELALELLDSPTRDALMTHVAGCSRCRAELESIASVADLVVVLAPECEPPVGFEQRAVDAMVGDQRDPVARSRGGMWLVAAAIVAVVGLGGVLIGRSSASHDPRGVALERIGIDSAVSARLLDASGSDHGSVLLTSGTDLLLTMRLANLEPGTYHCLLRAADGSTTEVAAWPIGASGSGSWALRIDAPLHGIDQVVLTGDDGSTLASAQLR